LKDEIILLVRVLALRWRQWRRRVYEARILKKTGYFSAEIAKALESLRRKQAIEEVNLREEYA